MKTEDTGTVQAALKKLASAASADAEKLPALDPTTILKRADERPTVACPWATARQFAPVQWIARGLAAAAVLAAAVGLLITVQPHPIPDGPVPEHLVELVDSLYSEGDYVHDQLAAVLWPSAETDDRYMDDIWDTVISGIEQL